MYVVPKIPGVTLEVYKEDRLLAPEADGYVNDGYGNNLQSGSAIILAVVDSTADKTIGFFRDGQDHYIAQKDWLMSPDLCPAPLMKEKQARRREFLAGRTFDADTKVYGVTMPLRVFSYERPPVNTVHYPENMLALAQYVRDARRLTGRVHVWEVALVSQNGKFFLTVHRHYNIPACRSVRGPMCFPRLGAHRLLERILLENAPGDLPLIPAEDIVPVQRSKADQSLGRYEGIVESWYHPKNMGAIITAQGSARAHWKDIDIPARRRRYLVEGEKVKFADLRVPPKNPKTDWRKVRKARFELQACGIEVG